MDDNFTQSMPRGECFASVVSTEVVQFGFVLAQIYNLQCFDGDVGNAFVTAYTSEKVYIVAGPEFGELKGRIMKMEKAVYGTKTAALRFHESLSICLRKIGFRPSEAEPDFWYQKTEYSFEYIAKYLDDVICFSKNPEKIMDYLKQHYVMKGVGYVEFYLGGDLLELPKTWKPKYAMSAKTYLGNLISNSEGMLKEDFKFAATPLDKSYHPEEDITDLCDPHEHSYYCLLICSANWCVTLGRFDITYAVSTLAQYSIAPQKDHLRALIQMYGYLKYHQHAAIPIDGSHLPNKVTDRYTFQRVNNWTEVFPDVYEATPKTAPKPFTLDNPLKITCYVNADHARNTVTRRSETSILLFINNTPLVWISKRQSTVETSTFGSEIIAACTAINLLVEI